MASRDGLGKALLLIAGMLLNCEVGGGHTDRSVRVPGEEGLTVKAESKTSTPPSRLVIDRKTHMQGAPAYGVRLKPKKHIVQTLRLETGEPTSKLATYILAEHDAASTFSAYEMTTAPDKRRIAYRLGDRPWRVVYLLTMKVSAMSSLEIPGKLDWAKVPTLEEHFVALYRANRQSERPYFDALKSRHIMEAVLEADGEAFFVARVAELLRDEQNHQLFNWQLALDQVSPAGLAALGESIASARADGIQTTSLHAQYAHTFRFGDEVKASDIEQSIDILSKSRRSIYMARRELVFLLRVLYEVNPTSALERAGRLLEAGKKEEIVDLSKGYPLQRLIVAMHVEQHKTHDAIDAMAFDPEAPESLCDGRPCKPEELRAHLAEDFEETKTLLPQRPITKTPDPFKTKPERLPRTLAAYHAMKVAQ